MKHITLIITSAILIIGLAAFACGCGAGSDSEDSSKASDSESTAVLEDFLGNWVHQESENSVDVVRIFEDGDRYTFECYGLPGGGFYVYFEPEDMTIEDGTLTCEDGHELTEGGEADGAKMIVYPSTDADGEMCIDYYVAGEDFLGMPTRSYKRVGSTQEELDEWLDDNYESLTQ